jgi:hypothetical protein
MPYEKFKSLPNVSQHLKPDITIVLLDAEAIKMSDNDAALTLNNAKELFPAIVVTIKKRA